VGREWINAGINLLFLWWFFKYASFRYQRWEGWSRRTQDVCWTMIVVNELLKKLNKVGVRVNKLTGEGET
jgi:hypothetical protein